jgi:hypothetical protein
MAKIEIFKPVHAAKSMEGTSVSLSAADLQAIAAGYNAAQHEAPCVIGHPTHDAPAYGWVKSLSFTDGALVADIEADQALKDLVAQKAYKKISASFYLPTAPGNPTPGDLALRHVGFLGAMAPGIKGLKAVSFAEGEEGVVTFGDLSGYTGIDIAAMFRRLRDWLIAKEGLDTADRVLPSWDVDSVARQAQRAVDTPDPDGAMQPASFADPDQSTQLTQGASMKTPEQLQAELDAANAALKTMQAAEQARLDADRATAAANRHAGHASFADSLVAAAKWPAGAKDVLVQALDVLAAPSEGGVVSFGEGDAAKPLASVLQEQLTALPAAVSFAEFAKKGASGASLTDREVASRAKAYQDRMAKGGQSISLGQAVDAVHAGTDQA